MRVETNECVGCASMGLPCYGDSCSNRHVIHYECDRCRDVIEPESWDKNSKLYDVNGEELCYDCLIKAVITGEVNPTDYDLEPEDYEEENPGEAV